MEPVRFGLSVILRFTRFDKFPSSGGIVPVKSAKVRCKVFKLVRFPISEGMGPVRFRPRLKSRVSNWVNWPIVGGIVTFEKVALDIAKYSNSIRFPILAGKLLKTAR